MIRTKHVFIISFIASAITLVLYEFYKYHMYK